LIFRLDRLSLPGSILKLAVFDVFILQRVLFMKRELGGCMEGGRYDKISPGGWDLGYLVYSDEDGKIWVRW